MATMSEREDGQTAEQCDRQGDEREEAHGGAKVAVSEDGRDRETDHRDNHDGRDADERGDPDDTIVVDHLTPAGRFVAA
jgi:hypothetical protein